MAELFHGDVSILRSLDTRRADSGIFTATEAVTVDRHSPSKLLCTAATAFSASLPIADLPVGWSLLVKNSGLSAENVSISVDSNTVLSLKPGRSAYVIAKIAAPVLVSDWEVIEIVPFDAEIEGALAGAAGAGLSWNSGTKKLDVNVGGGVEIVSDTVQLVKGYEKVFNATTDWGTASGGFYTISIPASTHGQGTKVLNPSLHIAVGADFATVHADRMLVAANGDVSFRVPSLPDLRFAGRVFVQAIRV
jgi:hypothetical protein